MKSILPGGAPKFWGSVNRAAASKQRRAHIAARSEEFRGVDFGSLWLRLVGDFRRSLKVLVGDAP